MIDPRNILAEANGLLKQRRPDQAEVVVRRGLRAYPRDAALHHQLAIVLMRMGRLDGAVDAAHDAVDFAPTNPSYVNTLASLLHMSRRLYEAELWVEKGLEIDERSAPLHNTMGTLLSEQHRIEEACDHFRRALELQPDRYDSNVNLARLLARLGRPNEALDYMQKAAAMRPDDIELQTGNAFDLNYNDKAEPREVFEAHRKLGAMYTRLPGPSLGPFANSKDPERRLRVAYLSADFRGHSVSYFFEPLAACHDSARFEMFIYSGTEEADHVTRRLQAYPGQWRETRELNDAALLELARRDQIDIVVDLSGVTIGHRMGALGKRLAPVQITYLGYPNTTGLPTMDYRIVDETTDPVGDEWQMTERPIRLPGCFICYRPPSSAPAIADPPSARGEPITYGSFNNLVKISPTTVRLWAQVLKATPGSRLMLRAKILSASLAQTHLRARFEQEGVDPERVDLIDFLPGHTDHMALYGRVDIALDTFPYHGTTTTCEAMWMGVPVVSLRGRVHAARVGASLLKTIGHEDWVAETPERFVEIAARLAADPVKLAARRPALREAMRSSSLCDQEAFTRKFEAALREAWARWCAGGAS